MHHQNHDCNAGTFQTKGWTGTDLGGLHSLGVGQADALPEVSEQVSGQSAPAAPGTNAVGDVPVFEGYELRVGHIVYHEGGALLRGVQEHRHAAVGGELDVQTENEVF